LRPLTGTCDDAHSDSSPAPASAAGASEASSSSASGADVAVEGYQADFINLALTKNVLQFGQFTLKSGRVSPYFFNAGLFCCGRSMHLLSRFYAQAVRASGVSFDVIFGPAYKGIPLAASIAAAWYDLFGESKDYCYNRKEAKDHGEGGTLVGASMQGKRVLVVDDVITAGTAIRECVDTLNAHKANIVAVTVSLDRQEKANDTCNESAIQMVEKDFNFPVISIVRLNHLITYVMQSGDSDVMTHLENILQYRLTYGVEY
jgi:orotate phosphoribosyltransferase